MDSRFPDGLVDIHTHAIADRLPDLSAYPGQWPSVQRYAEDRARILLDGAPYREIDDRCWSAEGRLRDMDAEGVAVQVVSPVPVTLCHDQLAEGAAVLAAAQNDFLAALVARAPDRFVALGAVALQDIPVAIAELARCVDQLGFAGVEIGTKVAGRELADPAFAEFFDAAAQRQAVVLVHPVDRDLDPRLIELGVGFGAGMPIETATAAAAWLTGTAPRPGLRLCLAHGAGALPSILPRLDRGARMARVPDDDLPSVRARALWCDSLTYDRPGLDLAIHRFGAGHVVLGTDYPFAARESPPGAVLTDDSVRTAIGRTNVLSLLGSVRRVTADRPGAPT